MIFTRLLPACALAPFLALSVWADEIKVDINNQNRPLSEGSDPAFTPWSTNSSWFPGGDVISNTFSGVAVTFRRVGTNGTSLSPGYWKEGVQNSPPDGSPPDYNCDLAGDGIKVNNGDVGAAQIEMRLSGLTPGSHTLLVYHNDWDNHFVWDVTPLNIFVDGIHVVTNLPQTVRVVNSASAATAYLALEAVANQEVVILFAANTSTAATKQNVWINGFEIDTPDSTLKAINPVPANFDEHVDGDAGTLLLSWTAAASAASHDVYFGTDSNAVRAATHASPEFKGNQTGTTFMVSNLSSLVTNFWRVDEVSASAVVTPGDLWRFRTRHLAFPGAEGYGRFARGGRGGVVVKVTNLNDSGPGSLRDAIEGDYGPRTVVFDVSGLITLQSDIIIGGTRPYITIAGQSAPGKGICIKRQQFAMSGARDVICRFMRIFVGKESGDTQNATGMAGVDYAIMDHCSFGWGIDEGISTRGARNLTLQRCFISEMLNIAGHANYGPGTKHGYAASIGGDTASFHHNLLAHNEGRNWSLAGGLDGGGNYAGRLDIFNNVVYNWGGRTTDGGAHEVNFVNNYYKPGPASSIFVALNAQYGGFPGTQQYYFEGNVMPGHFQTGNQSAGKTISTENNGTLPEDSDPPYSAWVGAPFFASYGTIDEVTNAYKKVLSDVGCNQPMVDDHDARIIRETIDGTYTYTGSVSGKHGLPDTTDDVGGWEDYGNYTRPAGWDTDDDGLPNWWEEIKGLNPNSAPGDFSDSNGDPDGDEYTNLEDYLNWMAEIHFDCTIGSSVDISLDQFARGYTNNSPSYSVYGATNGTVSLVSGKIARFIPTLSGNALGGFTFSVTDADGYSMARTVGIRLMTAAAPPILGIRNQSGLLFLEVTGQIGNSVSIKKSADVAGPWLEWTNVTATGSMQLLPLDGVSGEQALFFRATNE